MKGFKRQPCPLAARARHGRPNGSRGDCATLQDYGLHLCLCYTQCLCWFCFCLHLCSCYTQWLCWFYLCLHLCWCCTRWLCLCLDLCFSGLHLHVCCNWLILCLCFCFCLFVPVFVFVFMFLLVLCYVVLSLYLFSIVFVIVLVQPSCLMAGAARRRRSTTAEASWAISSAPSQVKSYSLPILLEIWTSVQIYGAPLYRLLSRLVFLGRKISAI